MSSAQGFDCSSYQVPVTAAQLRGYSFAFCKATNGPDGVDPNFAENWHTIKASSLQAGAYHELEAGSTQLQAEHFLAVVKDAGIRPGDLTSVVASDYAGVTDAEVAGFCAAVEAELPHSPVLVYTSLSVAVTLTSCTRWPLWLAYPADAPPESVWPWSHWTIWQWSFGGARDGGDRDAFNGSEAEMRTWISGYLPDPKPKPSPAPPPVPEEEDDAMMLDNGTAAVTAVTFPNGSQKQIGFGADAGLGGGHDVVLRVACHSAAKGWSQIETKTIGGKDGGRVVVAFTEPDVDTLSVQRVAESAGDDTPVGYSLP